MQGKTGLALALCAAGIIAQSADAGDRAGVVDALQSLPTNWPDALLSVDLDGTSQDGDVLIDHSVRVSYEAALPGYVTYLHVSSHGDMTLFRNPGAASVTGVGAQLEVKPPLGRNQLLILFSDRPLDPLFPGATNSVALGSDGRSAADFRERLAALEQGQIHLASRNQHYMVIARDEVSQGQTRAIVRTVESAGRQSVSMPRRIEFEFNSDRLTENAKLVLDTFGEALLVDLKAHRVMLEGHTDAMGTEEYNMELSQRRAEAAKEYLVRSFGIPPSRLSSVGRGMSAPLMPNDTEANREINRRVEFIFDGAPSN